MGRLYKLFFFLLLSLSLQAQNPEWINYTNGQNLSPHHAMSDRNKGNKIMITPKTILQAHIKMDGTEELEAAELMYNPQKNKNKLLTKLNGSKYYPVTVVIDNSQRFTYTYDNNGNLLTELEEYWKDNAWVNYWRLSYTYGNSGNLVTELVELWTINSWGNDMRQTYTYDNSGNLLIHLYELWSNNTWMNSHRNTYNYDNNGNLLTHLEEVWMSNAWVNSWRYIYTNDNSGNILIKLDERWTNNQWVNSGRTAYSYDNNSNMLTLLIEQWINNAWVNSQRATYTYDNSGNRLTWFNEKWTDTAWVNSGRAAYTYDNSGNKMTVFGEYWNNNAWVNSWRFTYSYDYNGNQLTYLYEQWWNNAWVNYKRYTSTYDNNGNAIKGEYFNWINNSWSTATGLLSLTYNLGEDNLSYQGSIAEVTYKLIITDVRDNGLGKRSYNLEQNYPNPFNPSTVFSWQLAVSSYVTLKVYDVLGNEVATLVNENQSAGTHQIEFQSAVGNKRLASGVYFYQLRAGSFVQTKKMIVLK